MKIHMQKKTYLFAALAALCLTACNENKQDPTPEVTTAAQTAAATTTVRLTETAAVTVMTETLGAKINTADAVRVLYPEAVKPNPKHLRGLWSFTRKSGYPDYFLAIDDNGVFSAYTVYDRKPDQLIANGTVTIEHWSYVFSCRDGEALRQYAIYSAEEDGRVREDGSTVLLTAKLSEHDPLNLLISTALSDGELKRESEEMLYERQYTRAEQAPQGKKSKIRVKAPEGFWSEPEGNYSFRVSKAGDLSGSFVFTEWKEDEASGDLKKVGYEGEVWLELGLDGYGDQQYFYNFYNLDSERILSLAAEELDGEWITCVEYLDLCPRFSSFRQKRPEE